jgi:hypothetical protein
MAELFKPLMSHKGILGLGRPYEITDIISYPKPVVATMAHWLNYPVEKATTEQEQQMLSLFG